MTSTWRPSSSPETLGKRASLLWKIREFFHDRGVIEVQTPVLGTRTVSDVQIDSIDLAEGYLQTSPEYFMKRLLATGAPSCYQIGPVFRKGESGTWHNPEFTMLEWYRLGFDSGRLRNETAELVDQIIGPATYETVDFRSLIFEGIGVDIVEVDSESQTKLARELGYRGSDNLEETRDFLFAESIRNRVQGRFFVVDFPSDAAALARTKFVDGHEVADRFELVVSGVELANGYNELLDADELQRRIHQDNEKRVRLSKRPIDIDERLIAAMHHGLPQCVGVAVGLDRLFALAMGLDNIQDVMTFPADRA